MSYYENLEVLEDVDEDGRVCIFQNATTNSDNWYYRLKNPAKGERYIRKSCRTKNREKAIEIATEEWESMLDKIAKDLPIPTTSNGVRKISMKKPRGDIEYKGGLYEIVNKYTGTIYVGMSKQILERWKQHRRNLRDDKHSNHQLQRDWNKWGEWSFDWKIQFYSPLTTKEDLEKEEQKRIREILQKEGKLVYNTSVRLLGE